MKFSSIHIVVALSTALTLLYGNGAAASEAPTAHWSITPYVWAPQTKLDLKLRDTNIGQGDISFGDLLDVLDAAFMINVEGGQGHWSAFGDMTYLKTSDTSSAGLLDINARNKQFFLDAAVAYWPGGVGSAFNLYAGLRLSAFDDRYKFSISGTELTTRKSKKDYYDALVGLRYRIYLAPHWAILTRADASFGDSEGTYLLQANLAWTVGSRELNRILVGYQYKAAKFKQGDLEQDYTYYGPLAGFNFRF